MLRHRTVRILSDAADLDDAEARALLDRADGELKTAIVTALSGVSVDRARRLLDESDGAVREALRRAGGAGTDSGTDL